MGYQLKNGILMDLVSSLNIWGSQHAMVKLEDTRIFNDFDRFVDCPEPSTHHQEMCSCTHSTQNAVTLWQSLGVSNQDPKHPPDFIIRE